MQRDRSGGACVVERAARSARGAEIEERQISDFFADDLVSATLIINAPSARACALAARGANHRADINSREAFMLQKGRPSAGRTRVRARLATAHKRAKSSSTRSTNNVLSSTQMEEGRLLRFHIDDITGELDNPCESTVLDVPHRDKEGKPFIGLHGLSLSEKFPGHAWATLQYVNLIVLVDIKTLAIKSSFPCPQTLADGETTIGGPHSVCEKKGHIYVTMKGGATCHGPPEESENGVEEATAHGVWRVAINDEGGVVDDGYVFMVAATPPMCAVDEQGDCWVVADAHPTVACIPFNAKSSADDLTGSGDSLGIEVTLQTRTYEQKSSPFLRRRIWMDQGLLNYVEMVSLCSSLDVGLSTDELTKLIRESDADGDGEISFDEFIAALRAHIGGSQKQQTTAGGLGAIFAAKSASSLPGAKSWWLPYQYAVACHGGGPGIVIGPDGQPWFCILTGVGLIGTIDKGGHIKVFELFNSGRVEHLAAHLSSAVGNRHRDRTQWKQKEHSRALLHFVRSHRQERSQHINTCAI